VQTLGGELRPRLLYRVSVDGKRELVRGAALDDLDQRALRSSVEQRQDCGCQLLAKCGDSVGAALLMDDITSSVQREEREAPFYRRAVVRSKATLLAESWRRECLYSETRMLYPKARPPS